MTKEEGATKEELANVKRDVGEVGRRVSFIEKGQNEILNELKPFSRRTKRIQKQFSITTNA